MADELEEESEAKHEEEDIYEEDYAEELEENDEISPEEEAFMKGYEVKKKKKKKGENRKTKFVKLPL
ncbi:hypothetical protein HYX16_02430 [Candidatus Woesearchaeota archaeon]|nr:hypothetical protein [Candidatus Woesearchaeota archaeon]